MSDMPALASRPASEPVVAHDVREYFHESVHTAIDRQKVSAEPETVFYLVNLLAQFTRAESLFDYTGDGVVMRPLALVYAQAMEAPSRGVRHNALKRLGDVALVVAGMFSASLDRKLVGVDYYIAMGGSAYAFLSNDMNYAGGRPLPAQIFAELAVKFQAFVDVLAEVSDNSSLRASPDILRHYENWAKTGSRRAAEQLRKLGVEPSVGSVSLRHS